MARGDMLVENATFGSGVEILMRPPYEGVSMTISFEGAADGDDYKTDKESGELYVPAGMPIDKDGKPQHETADNVVGILLVDVYKHRPQGTILKKAYINATVAKAHAGVSGYDDFAAKLPMIVFEEDTGK